MAELKTLYRVFIASPHNLTEERKIFNETIEEYNNNEALERGVIFKAIAWEETLGGYGRAQDVINKDLEKCDFFILLLHDWWGKPPKDSENNYSSGTEEEFHVALKCLKKDSFPMSQMVLFFKDINPSKLNDPGPQLLQVLAFKKERQDLSDFLWKSFEKPNDFKKIFLQHLGSWLRNHENNNIESLKHQKNISNGIKTHFTTNETDWINRFEKLEDWNLALEKAEDLYYNGKMLEADFIFNQIGTRCNIPFLLAKTARYYRRCGRFDRALDILLKANSIIDSNNPSSELAYLNRQLARLHELLKNWDLSHEKLELALNMYNKVSDQDGIARTYRDLGLLHNKQGLIDQAILDLT
jgi:tetratricopeptide (TPR) repeat protein